MKNTITVIGLGNMGGHIARTLQRNGFTVRGADINPSLCETLTEAGIESTLPENIKAIDIAIFSLPTSDHVESCLFGAANLADKAQSNAIFIDMSTGDPRVSRQLAGQLAEHNLHWVDAPVSGGPAGAKAGTLGVFLGGEADIIARINPILEALSAKYVHLGGAGTGHVAKLANNLLCAGNIMMVGQVCAFAQRQGLSPANLIEGINTSSGRSAVSEVNFPKWILSNALDSGFSFALMRKDLKLASEVADSVTMPDSLIQHVYQNWQQYGIDYHVDDNADFNIPASIELAKAMDAITSQSDKQSGEADE